MLENISCWTTAASNLELPIYVLHRDHNVIQINTPWRNLIFTNYSTPFNSSATSLIAKDKGFTYELLKDHCKMAQSWQYLDPFIDSKYQSYVRFSTYKAIATDISNNLNFPLIVKPNRGSIGTNARVVHDFSELEQAITRIFDHKSKYYDFGLIAQEYIQIAKEYRVLGFKTNNCQVIFPLTYLKDNSTATFAGNLSPLHWDGAKAIIVENPNTLVEIGSECRPVFELFDEAFFGLDVALDNQGKWWLLEINSEPNFSHFIRDNGDKNVVTGFQTILQFFR